MAESAAAPLVGDKRPAAETTEAAASSASAPATTTTTTTTAAAEAAPAVKQQSAPWRSNDVPVKKEFLRPPPERPAASSAATGSEDQKSEGDAKRQRADGEGPDAGDDDGDVEAADLSQRAGDGGGGRGGRGGGRGGRGSGQQQKRNVNKLNRVAKPPREALLCHATGRGEPCTNAGCGFQHDAAAFLAAKPADLGPRCYLFDTFGQCRFGLTCRYAGAHTTAAGLAVVDEAKVAATAGTSVTTGGLADALREKLRRREVPTPKAALLFPARAKHWVGHTKQMPAEPAASSSAAAAADDASAATASTADGDDETLHSEAEGRLRAGEKKTIDLQGKYYLAPLTTVGNLPFRRVCKRLGADITCGEMALAQNLIQGQRSEWALLKRHSSEDVFLVQVAGAHADQMTRVAELINEHVPVSGVCFNSGCPITIMADRGIGAVLVERPKRLEQIVRGMSAVLDVPLLVKIRTGRDELAPTALRTVVPYVRQWGAAGLTIHGRSRMQRYTGQANWNYIAECAAAAAPLPIIGNGDIYSFEEADEHWKSGVTAQMVGRGALIKPWIFTELKERRHWDISASERLALLQDFANFGLEHWGADQIGVDNTRRFLLEWLSFLWRYVPVGLVETLPVYIAQRPPPFVGRSDLETLMASPNPESWVRISEMLLGPAAAGFSFTPKHKSNAYDVQG